MKKSGLLFGWGEALSEIFKFLNNIFNYPSKQIAKVVSIYDAMHKAMDDSNIERILVLKAHNGGGLIKPDTPLYCSVLYENYEIPFYSVKDLYQRIILDEDYIRMLLELIRNRGLSVETKNLKPGLLKNIYEAEGVIYSEIYFLGQDRKNVYYCSCATSKVGQKFEVPTDKLAISLLINTLRNNIK